MIVTITWLTVIMVTVVLYLRQMYTTMSKAGVNHLPVVPIFGHVFQTFFRTEHITETLMRTVNAFPKDKVLGFYRMLNPVYMITDLETLKKITIKDFEHFVDRTGFVTDHDYLLGRSLLNLKGEDWKQMRSTLSPAFTSSKIRLMVPLMVEVGEEMMKVLQTRIKDSEKGHIDVELKDLTSRYANDVIASCAFGLKVNSHSDDNEFYLKSKDVSRIDFFRDLKILFYTSFPSLATKLKVSMSSQETSDYLSDVVLSTMKSREKNNIIRHDMINILKEVKKGNLSHENTPDTNAGFATVEESAVGKKTYNREWTDLDLVAQAALFLFAGFDTVSTMMTFIIFELANNPDVQKRLVKEIKDYDTMHGSKFDFKSIQRMEYMDMVVSESLRLHPVAGLVDRKCVKDYNLGKANNTSNMDVILRKGDVIGIPIWIYHRNPELFPDPLKFDPERFCEKNKHAIKPNSFMPFGIGPRNCIGSRFALCEIKVMLYQLLRVLEIVPCEKTTYPAKLDNGFRIRIRNGAWIRLKLRP